MTTELTPETFDLISVLAGRSYPTLERPIYFNESLGFEIFQLEKKRSTEFDAAKVKKLDAEISKLVKQAKKEQYTVTVQSIPDQARKDIHNAVLDEYPSKKSLVGQEEPHPEADSEYTRRMWSAYIQVITNPDGAVTTVDLEVARALHDSAPSTVHETINQAIGELQSGAKAGFEIAAKEADFLSGASHGA